MVSSAQVGEARNRIVATHSPEARCEIRADRSLLAERTRADVAAKPTEIATIGRVWNASVRSGRGGSSCERVTSRSWGTEKRWMAASWPAESR